MFPIQPKLLYELLAVLVNNSGLPIYRYNGPFFWPGMGLSCAEREIVTEDACEFYQPVLKKIHAREIAVTPHKGPYYGRQRPRLALAGTSQP